MSRKKIKRQASDAPHPNSPAALSKGEPGLRGRLLCHCVCFLLLVSIHILFSRGISVPTAMYDEFIYLAFGRYFSGVAHMPNMQGAAFGAFGYGLLIAPAFRVGSDFAVQFQAVLFINAVLISSAYFPLQFIARTLFGMEFVPSVIAAFVTCLYSSYLLFSSFALSDNAFVPFFLFLVTAAWWVVQRPGFLSAILFGGLSGCLYAIHSRSLGVIAASVLLLLFLVLKRMLPAVPAATGIGVLGAVVLLVRYFTRELLVIGWAGLGEVTVSTTLQQVLGPGAIQSIFSCLVGHVWYLAVCTLGIGVLGSIFLGFLAIKVSCDPLKRVVAAYILIATALVFAVSLLFISGYGRTELRPDFIATGRYWEGAMPLLLLSGFAVLSRWPVAFLKWTVPTCVLMFVGSTVLLLPRFQNLEWLSNPASRINIFALMGWLRFWSTYNILLIAAASALLFLLIVLVSRRAFIASTLLAATVFVTVAASERKADIIALQQIFAGSVGGHAQSGLTGMLHKFPPGTQIGYDMANWIPFYYANYQLQNPDIRVSQFNSKQDFTVEKAVISGAQWTAGTGAVYKKLGCENTGDNCLYVKEAEYTKFIDTKDFIGQELGSRIVPGVVTDGLYPEEGDNTFRYRWTNGRASVTVPLSGNKQPLKLVTGLLIPDKYSLTISCNGEALVDENSVNPGRWAREISLPPVPVQLTGRCAFHSKPARLCRPRARALLGFS